MPTQLEPHARTARTETKALRDQEEGIVVRTLHLGLESTGHSRLAFGLLTVVAILLYDTWFDFWPRWERAILALGPVLVGQWLVHRLLATRVSIDATFLRVEQPSRSQSLIIPWAAIAFVEVRDGNRLLICRHSGEATIVGPFVKSYPNALSGKLELAAELAEAAIERQAERALTT